jgi:hypothetical protein
VIKKNIREIVGKTDRYSKFVREERNLAAIFYHVLLQGDNTERFFNLIKTPYEKIQEEFGIYFEYAYLRDLWHGLKRDDRKKKIELNLVNEKKIEIIKKFLPHDIFQTDWRYENVEEFNNYFVFRPSKQHIQNPGRWNISRLNKNIKNNDEFEAVCKFKWAFNIKPDIVIHTSLDSAVCIETKLESVEGSYPQNKNEKKIFNDVKRELNYIKQTEMQKYLMKKLLGIKTSFVLLVKENVKPPPDYIVKTWTDLFAKLDTNDSLPFMKDMMEN